MFDNVLYGDVLLFRRTFPCNLDWPAQWSKPKFSYTLFCRYFTLSTVTAAKSQKTQKSNSDFGRSK